MHAAQSLGPLSRRLRLDSSRVGNGSAVFGSLDTTLARFGADVPPEARARVDEITHLIVEKLLLTPTEQLKSLGNSETVAAYAEALTRLFALADQQAAEQGESERPKGGRIEPFKRPTGRQR